MIKALIYVINDTRIDFVIYDTEINSCHQLHKVQLSLLMIKRSISLLMKQISVVFGNEYKSTASSWD